MGITSAREPTPTLDAIQSLQSNEKHEPSAERRADNHDGT